MSGRRSERDSYMEAVEEHVATQNLIPKVQATP
jgi:hypothetical protein